MADAKKQMVVPSEDVDEVEYLYAKVTAPRLGGFLLKCFAWLLEIRLANALILPLMKKANLITKVFMETRYSEPPMYCPQFSREIEEQGKDETVQILEQGLSTPERVAAAVQCLPPYTAKSSPSDGGDEKSEPKFQYATIRDYAHAYSSGRVTPTQVAQRFLAAVQDSQVITPGLNLFISQDAQDVLAQAAAATERYQQGKQLSVLDGVPIAVKDEIDCLPYPTTGGSTWLAETRDVKEDATAVKRLRECGAVLVGKTNMHELGMGTTGINPHYGPTRNPHDRSRASGGSSGGSAAIVAAGLCPAALGVDGGGSVRMPAGLCGIVGLKPTFGRTTKSGLLSLSWTVGMLGTLTGSVEDAHIMYAAVQGHLPTDRLVSIPPPATIPLLKNPQMEPMAMAKVIGDIKFAKFSKWFNDADHPIRDVCDKALQLVQDTYGCKVVDVAIPEIEEMRLAHYITIASESSASIGVDFWNLGRAESGGDVRATFSMFQCFNNREFVTAQRLRFRCMQHHNDIFKKADFIITPTTGCTAPLIRQGAESYGELDYLLGSKLMRYVIAGNFLGLPAISIPIGYDHNGLPVGLQLIGRPWSEAKLVQVADVFEKLCAPRHKPEVYYDLLN